MVTASSRFCETEVLGAYFGNLAIGLVVVCAIVVIASYILAHRLTRRLLTAFYDAHLHAAPVEDEWHRLMHRVREEMLYSWYADALVLIDESYRKRSWWALDLPTIRAWIGADPRRECQRRAVMWLHMAGPVCLLGLGALFGLLFLAVGWWCVG